MAKPPSDVLELTVGQLAARSGVAVSAVHFYEAKGLDQQPAHDGQPAPLHPRHAAPARGDPGRPARRHSTSDGCRGPGRAARGRTPTREDWARLSAGWRSELDVRIDQLTRLRDRLTDCIGCGCLSIDRCALRNPEDRLGDAGTGPRRLLSRRLADEQ